MTRGKNSTEAQPVVFNEDTEAVEGAFYQLLPMP